MSDIERNKLLGELRSHLLTLFCAMHGIPSISVDMPASALNFPAGAINFRTV